MKKYWQRSAAFLIVIIVIAACTPIFGPEESQASSNQVATAAAMTLQALSPATSDTSADGQAAPSNLLPRSLYFLSNDNQSISQVYRLERDGKTKTQLTFEPVKVWAYDISTADGSLAFETNGQLILVNADGSNRRLVAQVSAPDAEAGGFFHPTFSPDGKTLAYAHGGLNLYDLATGASSLVITDQLQDNGSGQLLPVETYSPVRYSPDGTKLLVALGHWEVAPSDAIYYPGSNTLVRHEAVTDYIVCCSFHGGPSWTPDSSSFYGVASVHDSAFQFGQLWRVDATTGAITRMLTSGNELPKDPYLAPDGQLYFFYGFYSLDSGFFDAPVLQLVRASPNGVTGRTVLRDENFVLMNEALWAPDASFVVVATAPDRNWNQAGGVLELYTTNGQKSPIWLASFGKEMKWGP
jgi:Tol biopolymer transport system component